jgi:hypothetical protein
VHQATIGNIKNMTEIITTDTILNFLKQAVEQKKPLSPAVFADAAQKLVTLMGDEHDHLFVLQQEVARAKVEFIEQGDSVAKAKAKVEASDVYRQMCGQKAKIERIEETIRIAKLRARLSETEFKGY